MEAAPAIKSESGVERERQWLEAARAGDHEAFRWIVELYQARLYTFLLRMVRQHEEAEDLAQETFVRAWRNLAGYDARWSLRTWLFAIARNLALNALRRPRAKIVSLDGGDENYGPAVVAAASGGSPADLAAAREQKGRLDEALEELTPRAAMIFTLFYQEAMTIAEIARAAGMTAGAVKVALHRARETLRERLAERPAAR